MFLREGRERKGETVEEVRRMQDKDGDEEKTAINELERKKRDRWI